MKKIFLAFIVVAGLTLIAQVTSSIQVPATPNIRRATSTVMPVHPSSTDVNNPLGTFDVPRKTIPNVVAPGTVVEVIGPYTTNHTSPNNLRLNGTPEAPIVIRGSNLLDLTSPTVNAANLEITGAHWTLEGLKLASVVLIAPNTAATVQFNDISSGNPAVCGGIGIQSYNQSVNSNIVLYRNRSHHNGNYKATFDQDCHGINIGVDAQRVWVEENLLHHNSGDGIQINAGARNHARTKGIFVVRNSAWENKQGGFWSKQATDVIFFKNKAWGHKPSDSSPGAQIGAQYGPEHLWIVENEVWDGDLGIKIASDIGDGSDGKYIFIMDNYVHDITDSNGDFNAANSWQDCGISVSGGTFRYIMRNRLQNVKSGICNTATAPGIYAFEHGSTVAGLLGGRYVVGTLTPVGAPTIQALFDYFARQYPR